MKGGVDTVGSGVFKQLSSQMGFDKTERERKREDWRSLMAPFPLMVVLLLSFFRETRPGSVVAWPIAGSVPDLCLVRSPSEADADVALVLEAEAGVAAEFIEPAALPLSAATTVEN